MLVAFDDVLHQRQRWLCHAAAKTFSRRFSDFVSVIDDFVSLISVDIQSGMPMSKVSGTARSRHGPGHMELNYFSCHDVDNVLCASEVLRRSRWVVVAMTARLNTLHAITVTCAQLSTDCSDTS